MLQRQQLAAVERVAAAIQRDAVVAAALVPAVEPGVAPDRLLAQLPTAPGVLPDNQMPMLLATAALFRCTQLSKCSLTTNLPVFKSSRTTA